MITPETCRPLNDFVLVRKCVHDHLRKDDGSVLLYRTDYDYDTTNWAEILKVGPKCKIVSAGLVGFLVQCPENVDGMHRVADDLWMIREQLLTRKEVAGIALNYDQALT